PVIRPQPAQRRGVERQVSGSAVTWAPPVGCPKMWPSMRPAGASMRVEQANAAPGTGTAVERAAADPDVALMLQVQGGDETAFQELFRKFSPRVLQYARRLVGSEARAEELTQDTFVQVFRFRARYRPESRFSTWLFAIATNLCLNELRRP